MAGHLVLRLAGPGGTGELIYDAEGRDGHPVSLVAGSPRGELDDYAGFRRMARVRSELNHPGTLPVYDWGRQDGTRYLVTAPYPPEKLSDLLARRRLRPEAALTLLAPLAEALDLCHSRGLVHQNLTDQSILLDGDHAFLDGFALTTGGPDLTWDTYAAHDLRYGTPESMRGEPLEPASNIYSLTALLVHLLTGRAPYEGHRAEAPGSAWAAGIVHLMEPPPRLRERAPHLGSEIDGVIAWGMAKDPSERPASATALLRAAGETLGVDTRWLPSPNSATVSAPVGPPDAVSEPPRRRRAARLRRPAVIAAAAVLGLAGGAIVDPFGDEPAAPVRDEAPAIAQLSERRAELRDQLAQASTPQEQADTAMEIVEAYGAALEATPPGPVADATKSAGFAYWRLAAAAEDGDEAVFAESAAEITRAERRLAARVGASR